MKKKKTPPVKVIERKLGQYKAVGLAHHDDKLIEIDPRQTDYNYMLTMVHEMMHLQFPKFTEKQIITYSRAMTKFLWDNHFRRVYNIK